MCSEERTLVIGAMMIRCLSVKSPIFNGVNNLEELFSVTVIFTGTFSVGYCMGNKSEVQLTRVKRV